MARNEHPTEALRYIQALYAVESPLLQKINQAIYQLNVPIHINPEEGKLLAVLVQLFQPKKILEIGTLLGYSTAWMASTLPSDGHIITLEKNPEHARLAKELLLENSVITLIEGNALTVLPTLTAFAPFDMVFIDADKLSYPDYLAYCEPMLRSGGLLVADNTLLSGAVYQAILPERVRPSTRDAVMEFNRQLADKSRFCTVMLPSHDGLTLAVKC